MSKDVKQLVIVGALGFPGHAGHPDRDGQVGHRAVRRLRVVARNPPDQVILPPVAVGVLDGELRLPHTEKALYGDHAYPVILIQGLAESLQPGLAPHEVGQPRRHGPPDGRPGGGATKILRSPIGPRGRRRSRVAGQGDHDLLLPAERLAAVPGETRVDNTARGAVPVPFPIGDRPKFIRVKAVFRPGGTASGHEFMDESPVRQVYPVPVEDVAHGRAPELMTAQSLQRGVTRPTGKLAQLPQVIHEALRDARLVTFHQVPLTALRK